MPAMPLLVGVLCVFAIGYRYYSAFLAARVMVLDDSRRTPAHENRDRQNFHPTSKWVLFGHHFAAISGAGPLVGPVLAAQFGYLPGLIWLVVGVVIGGAAQDFMVLVCSVRSGGRSLASIARNQLGSAAGRAAALAILFIVVNALAGLGLVVVKALGGESHAYPAGSVLTVEAAAGSEETIRLLRSDDAEALYEVPPPNVLSYPGLESPIRSTNAIRVAVPVAALAGKAPVALAGGSRLETPPGSMRRISGSSWGVFTIACTIPIALLVGLWMYRLRPGKTVEASIAGGLLVLLCVWLGGLVHDSPTLGPIFELSREKVIVALCVYAFFASVLPVWLLLLPRDYLSTFLKLGTVFALVVGVLLVNPRLQMPPTTQFASEGGGPVVYGQVFPFVFIVIMCGAISGFHALVASGTTPKLLDRESHARTIGYGAMLLEGLVGVVALIAACSLPPADYFKINVDLQVQPAFQDCSKFPDVCRGEEESQLAFYEEETREQLQGRSGGAVSLAVGMTRIFSGLPFFQRLVPFFYHFCIMFEALFILTTIDAGIRIARFLLQEMVGKVWAPFGRTDWLPGAIISSAAMSFLVGYFIWTGGIDTIWPMFGIANQLLALVALCVVTTYLINSGRKRYAWVSLVPMAWILTTTMTAGFQMAVVQFPGRAASDPAHAFRWKLNIGLTLAMLALVAFIVTVSVRRWIASLPSAGRLDGPSRDTG